jgi:hypothetical protein
LIGINQVSAKSVLQMTMTRKKRRVSIPCSNGLLAADNPKQRIVVMPDHVMEDLMIRPEGQKLRHGGLIVMG